MTLFSSLSTRTDYATAAEAMALLKVQPQTLYAYVSRGWIRSVIQKGQKEKLYSREDLARVSSRSLARSGHGPVAASAMNWGEPIFSTSITEITDQGPHYRGYPAIELVQRGLTFEQVAELLWAGKLMPATAQSITWDVGKSAPELMELLHTLAALDAGNNLLEVFSMVVLMLGMRRGTSAQHMDTTYTLVVARETDTGGLLRLSQSRANLQPLAKRTKPGGRIGALTEDGRQRSQPRCLTPHPDSAGRP
jgi:citrate synthase